LKVLCPDNTTKTQHLTNVNPKEMAQEDLEAQRVQWDPSGLEALEVLEVLQ